MPKVTVLYDILLDETHTLIAGTTGSGKTTVIYGMLVNALFRDCDIWLIDPKGFELMDFKDCAQVRVYANSEKTMVNAIKACEKELQRRRSVISTYPKFTEKVYQGRQLYLFIDELGDLFSTSKREITKPLERIMRLGRAAGIHVIAGTQRPSNREFPTEIRNNFTGKVGLKVNKISESKLILDMAGCENLPEHHAYFNLTGYEIAMLKVPKYDDDFIIDVIKATTPAAENACITVA